MLLLLGGLVAPFATKFAEIVFKKLGLPADSAIELKISAAAPLN